jgi:hypothetical protein
MNYAQTAQSLAARGRYGDSMLVHMTPQEVGGLQALARSQGTSLTINPATGLPEAFSMRNILPMAVGAALTVGSGGTLSPLTIGLMTGGLGALATGSLKEGLMMGLGAAGGAGLAGSMANLASPAIAAEGVAGGVAGGTGVTAGTAITPEIAAGAMPPPTDYGLTAGSTLPGAGGLQTMPSPISLDPLAPMDLTQPIGDYALPSQSSLTGLSTPSTVPLTDTIPGVSGTTLTGAPTPPTYMDRVGEGFDKATSSMDAFGDYLGSNKMNLAMSAAPALMASVPEAEPIPGQEQFIRPYTLEVDNLSGADRYAPGSTQERDQLRYRYTPQPIFRAAQGGIVALAEGGETVNSPFSAEITPEAAKVYSSIARTQGLVGMPVLDVSQFNVRAPERMTRPQIERQMIDTSEKNYNVYRPTFEDSPSFKEIQKAKEADTTGMFGGFFGRMFGMGGDNPVVGYTASGEPIYERAPSGPFIGTGMASGGIAAFKQGKEVRKKVDRMADPYDFADYRSNKGLHEAATKNFAEGGQPRFLSGGGDGMSDSIPATIGNSQPARLADGEFVIPADVVSHLGNGSSKAGAKQLYAMMDRIRKQRTGKKNQAPEVNPRKAMPV